MPWCCFLPSTPPGALLPTGIIGLRALKDSVDPAAIFPTTLLATAISTVWCGCGEVLSPASVLQAPAQREADAAIQPREEACWTSFR